MNIDSWLTARRVRIHGLLLAVCLWTVYAVDMSTPGLLDRNGLVKGTDFLHFYTLGTLALRGRGDLLYNIRAQAELARELSWRKRPIVCTFRFTGRRSHCFLHPSPGCRTDGP